MFCNRVIRNRFCLEWGDQISFWSKKCLIGRLFILECLNLRFTDHNILCSKTLWLEIIFCRFILRLADQRLFSWSFCLPWSLTVFLLTRSDQRSFWQEIIWLRDFLVRNCLITDSHINFFRVGVMGDNFDVKFCVQRSFLSGIVFSDITCSRTLRSDIIMLCKKVLNDQSVLRVVDQNLRWSKMVCSAIIIFCDYVIRDHFCLEWHDQISEVRLGNLFSLERFHQRFKNKLFCVFVRDCVTRDHWWEGPNIVKILSYKIWQNSDKTILLKACKGIHLLIRSD